MDEIRLVRCLSFLLRSKSVQLHRPAFLDDFFARKLSQLLSTNQSVCVPLNIANQHWVLVCLKEENVFFIDSLGKSLEQYSPLCAAVVLRSEMKFRELHYRVQPDGSRICGLYCLFFAAKIFASDCSWERICALLSPTQLLRNEAQVTAWFLHVFRRKKR